MEIVYVDHPFAKSGNEETVRYTWKFLCISLEIERRIVGVGWGRLKMLSQLTQIREEEREKIEDTGKRLSQ